MGLNRSSFFPEAWWTEKHGIVCFLEFVVKIYCLMISQCFHFQGASVFNSSKLPHKHITLIFRLRRRRLQLIFMTSIQQQRSFNVIIVLFLFVYLVRIESIQSTLGLLQLFQSLSLTPSTPNELFQVTKVKAKIWTV